MNTLITNIGQLVTPVSDGSEPDGAKLLDIREDTELFIRDGRISAIGRADRQETVDTRIDARGGVLIPGLIDPHTHFSVPVESDATGSDPAERNRRVTRARLCRALTSGVTTVEVKCRSLAELGELSALVRSSEEGLPDVVVTLFGGAPAPGATHAERMSGLIGDEIPTARRRRLAQFCDVECGGSAYTLAEARTILRAARAAGLQLKLHAAAEIAGSLGEVSAELGITAVGHLTQLGAGEAASLRSAGVVPVLLPSAGLVGVQRYPNARRMLDEGLSVGLGTDAGSASIAAGSMWLVVALAVGALEMSLEQAIVAATLHNAHALELAAEIGTVELGKRADLLILDIEDYRDLLAGLGEDPVRTVIRNGEVVHRR
jgi:imidazolonepropionase